MSTRKPSAILFKILKIKVSPVLNLWDVWKDLDESNYGGSGGTTAPVPTPAAASSRDLPEIQTFEIELQKDNQGQCSIFSLELVNLYCIEFGNLDLNLEIVTSFGNHD